MALKRSSASAFVHCIFSLTMLREEQITQTTWRTAEVIWFIAPDDLQANTPALTASHVSKWSWMFSQPKFGMIAAETPRWPQSTYRLLRDKKWFLLLKTTEFWVFCYALRVNQNIFIYSVPLSTENVLETAFIILLNFHQNLLDFISTSDMNKLRLMRLC